MQLSHVAHDTTSNDGEHVRSLCKRRYHVSYVVISKRTRMQVDYDVLIPNSLIINLSSVSR